MRADLKTIFSKISIPYSDKIETEKISYWLEKLFRQEKEEIEKRDDQARTVEEPSNTIPNMTEQSTEEKGVEEAVQSQVKKTEIDKHKLENMVTDSNQTITTASSVFPWTFFPTTITVEKTRITIIHRQLFSSQVHSVDIKDISNVLIESGVLFATIILISRTFVQNDIKINGVWKKDALFIRRIIEGLRMMGQENMDTTSYTVEELIHKLKELSTTRLTL